jgi:MFS family permease
VPGQSTVSNHQVRALLAMIGVALLLNYVETMVIPGVPIIKTDFNTTESLVSWITSAFLIVGSAVSPLFGKLGDSYGKKRMFLVALVFYTAGVGIAGFSNSIYFLIVARAVQGIGFAIVPLALAIIAETFPRERIAQAQGIVSATFAIGAALGLIIGSYVVQDLGWQWAFHTAFILSVLLFAIVARFLPEGHPGSRLKVDYQTVVLLMSGVSLLLLYLTEGPYIGWSDPYNLAALGLGAVLTIAFFFAESRKSNPLIPLHLLRIRNVLVANLTGILSGIGMFMLFFAVVFYTELPFSGAFPNPGVPGLDLDVITAGLSIAPATVLMLVGGPALGRMVARYGPKPAMVLGGLIAVAGFSLFIINRGTRTDVMVDTAVSLIGAVGIIIPIVNMVSVSLPMETVATGLGLNTMLRNIGGAIGPVVATTIMSTYYVTAATPVGPMQFPASVAYDYVFYLGIACMLAVVAIALTAKNYTFKKQPSQ